jgi:hypothetical protein
MCLFGAAMLKYQFSGVQLGEVDESIFSFTSNNVVDF